MFLRVAGRLFDWIGPPGRGPAGHGKPPGRASQAVGRFEARHYAVIFIVFLIVLNSRIVSKFQNL
jgi:hypothetical protein